MLNWRTGAILLLVVALIALPQLPFGEKDLLTLLISLFILAALSSSWNILGGFVGHINLGHGAFFGIGSLVTRSLWLDQGWHILAALAVGGVVAAIVALIVGAPALRLRGTYFAIGTLALAEAMRLTVGNVLPRVSRLPGPELRVYDIEPRYYLALVVLALIVGVSVWLSRSRIGLGMMAVREDEEAARSLGVNVFLHSMLAFVLSAFFAGLAGGAFAFFHVGYYPNYTFGPVWTFDAVIVTYVGGVGTVAGPLLGAIFFVLIRDVLAANLVNIHLIIFGILFIAIVLLLPGGFVELLKRRGQRLIPAGASTEH
ncbi:MAG: branched-chain amino acid ABC transporter permease [Anaerolineae bacterium]|nr:branched-chain amino acid ABC transporter permease [Anaerolineae bacterium]